MGITITHNLITYMPHRIRYAIMYYQISIIINCVLTLYRVRLIAIPYNLEPQHFRNTKDYSLQTIKPNSKFIIRDYIYRRVRTFNHYRSTPPSFRRRIKSITAVYFLTQSNNLYYLRSPKLLRQLSIVDLHLANLTNHTNFGKTTSTGFNHLIKRFPFSPLLLRGMWWVDLSLVLQYCLQFWVRPKSTFTVTKPPSSIKVRRCDISPSPLRLAPGH